MGNRSIIASPLTQGIKDRINSAIKFRESYRPLAISGIMPYIGDILDLEGKPYSTGAYMLSVAPLNDFKLQGFSHVDTTIRYQIVNKEFQGEFFNLIECFGKMSGCYALVNTSFNTYLEPIVESPIDAFRQYVVSDADLLLIEDWQLSLKDIPLELVNSIRANVFKEMNLSPLEVAFYFHYRGYHERALEIIQKIVREYPNFLQGRSDTFIRRYYVCLMRIYMHIGETCKAHECALQILKHASLSTESKEAVEVMSNVVLSKKEKEALKFIKKIASPGGGYDLFSKIVE